MGSKNTKQVEKKKELTEREIQLIQNSTDYTRQAIVDFYENNFVKLYPNGILFKDDFFKLYKELYPHKENTNEFLELIFDAFDRDKNGFLTFPEFLIAVSLSGHNDPEKKLRLAFSIYDYNNNGRLEKEEIDAIINGLRALADEVDKGKFDELNENDLNNWDKDKNGYLTEDEFIQFVLSEPLLKKYFLNIIKVHE